MTADAVDIPGPTPADIAAAASRIAPYVLRTPLRGTRAFDVPLILKMEHLQRSGSFKLRGALNRMLLLDEAERRAGVVTASTGNHGMGVAVAGALLGVPVTLLVASGTSEAIIEQLRAEGADVRVVTGTDAVDAEVEARRLADADGRVFVSPYNDAAVIAGQGTIGMEILEQVAEGEVDAIDALVVAVGGGGLISGIATWIKAHRPELRIVGASPAADAAMAASVRSGRIVQVDARPTLSHSTAGGIEPGAITFPICRARVDQWLEVDEADIADAIRRMLGVELQLVEGAAGVALAAAARLARDEPGLRVAAVSCGARLTLDELRQVLG